MQKQALYRFVRRNGFPLGLTLLLSFGSYAGAQTKAAPATASESPSAAKPDEKVYALSPFEVNTSKDKGYYVANSTSGTMLNTPLQDLPMPIQVIDSQFMSDIGATSLKNALKYTSGIQLQTFNSVGVGISSFSNEPGKLNNPEGNSANASQVAVKFRGFETTSVLRDGFARGNSADQINIDRVELVGGPQALLYGVSNFGGVVNYYVKQPMDKPASNYSLSLGSYNSLRATGDVTGPISDTLSYRLTGAYQKGDSWTDFNKENHYFISPILKWRPFERTKVTIDAEYGHQKRTGISWQNLRAAPGFINQSQNNQFGFLGLNGRDPRTFRWSGPDTYNKNTATNFEFKVEQEIAHNLNFWAGFNRSTFKYSQLDNMAALMKASAFGSGSASPVPSSAVSPIQYVLLDPNETGASFDNGPIPSTVAYQWQGIKESTASSQARANLAYNFKLFENSRWLKSEHTVLLGLTYQRNTDNYSSRQTPGNVANFHSPADPSYFYYGKQGNGSPDRGMTEYDNHIIATPDFAKYAIYQGKFIDNRLTLVAGVRHDRSFTSTWAYSPEFDSTGHRNGSGPGIDAPSITRSTDSSDRTFQWGASFQIVPGLNVFALNSGGFSPNYSGLIGTNGQPLGATLARDSEVGLKFDLGEGKVSGAISYFRINRTNAPVAVSSSIWNPPAMFGGKVHYDSAKNIVYMLGSSGSAGTMVDGDGHAITDAASNMWAPNSGNLWKNSNLAALWTAGVNAGAIYEAKNSGGNTNWYVDVTKAAGNAYLTSFYNVGAQAAKADEYGGWYGWFWDVDNVTNNPSADQFGNSLARLGGSSPGAITGSDRSSGIDANLLLRPNDNLQILLQWTYTKRIVVNGGDWIDYPTGYGVQFAPWNTPWYSWLTGANGTDANGRSALSGQNVDDAPAHQGSVWVQYTFADTDALKGWSFGAGAIYTGARAWFTGVNYNITDKNGAPLQLKTPSTTVFNCMARYNFKFAGHPSSLQLNVDNVVNNHRQLLPGVWRDPRTWSLNFSTQF